MISPSSKTTNSVAEWSQNWLKVTAFDPVAIERWIPYIYQTLGLPTQTILYLNGWQEYLYQILSKHADLRDMGKTKKLTAVADH